MGEGGGFDLWLCFGVFVELGGALCFGVWGKEVVLILFVYWDLVLCRQVLCVLGCAICFVVS